ncbi:MAG TPA: ADP-forming succinate--CoA ligase subunit beta [Gammaproteobacteria bacterium]|nr:ADP-forming succinate--CoA ligase subunit beta [Gammaproteobacteria bacterium]
MNIHEYQAKQILSRYGVGVPRGAVAYTPEEAERVAKDLGASGFVVKAQILAGDRGPAGGVRMVSTPADVREAAAKMLGTRLTTAQTGVSGDTVSRVYVEEACDVTRELYVGMIVDRATARVTLISSREGGTDIEVQVGKHPESVNRFAIDPEEGLSSADAREVAAKLGLEGAAGEAAEHVLLGVYEAFTNLDASLVELNPLGVTRDQKLLALDAKMSFDDNALFRHKQISDLRDREDAGRLERARHGFNYIKLDGNIGCLVNGAGLAMATMDVIKASGGRPANFLDVPPVATREQISEAFKLILSDSDVVAVLINVIGGGITRCDAVADGIASAYSTISRRVPLVVRFEGTNRDLGKKTLRDTGVDFIPADTLVDAANKVVRAAGGR